ncbi:hypothetical protein K492DRAFT_192141 [Lichtheimia hyalospora FSU 10163]|nr:hypothetical protein K492DRAFT_192141 [Lichtheimia hyalospora FSU 10163]
MAAAQATEVDMTDEIDQVFGLLPRGRGKRGCTRVCDLHPLLREQYRVPLKTTMKAIAEMHHLLHRDAYNLMNLHIRRFLENNDQHPFAAPPVVTAQTLWAWAYKYVNYPANHPGNVRVATRGQMIPQINDLRNTYIFYFRPLQLDDEQQPLYDSPRMVSSLENIMAERFAREAVTNVKEMLQRNIPGYIKRVCYGYLVHLDITSEANWDLLRRFQFLIPIIVDGILENNPEAPVPLAIQQAGFQGFIDMDIRQQLNNLLPGVDLAEMATGRSRALQPDLALNIVRFSGWLLVQADFLDARRWSLLPMASLEIGFFHIDRRVLWVILKQAHELNPGFLPNQFLTPQGRFIALQVFENMFNTGRQQEILWETFLNLDHVQKRRWRYQGARQLIRVHLPGAPIRFANHIVTDGHSCRVYFERPNQEGEPPFQPESILKVNMLPRLADLDNVRTGMYVLSKEPNGLDAQRLAGARIVGVDPGKREMITAIAHEDNLANLVHGRRDTVIEVPARHYQHVTQLYWNYQVEEINRDKANMQEVYTDLSQHTGLVADVDAFQERITSLSQNSDAMVNFATHWCHRQKRRFMLSARMSYQQQMINEIRGISPPLFPNEPVHRMHTTSKSERRIARRLIRRNMGWERPQGETIVAYGNAVLGHMRTYAPMPHWGFIEKLAREVLVIFIDEYRTSISCHHCGARLQLLYNNFLNHCTHKKKKLREGTTATGNRRHKNTFCLDEEGNVLGLSIMCPQAGPVAAGHWRNLVYALKECPEHGILGRDVNAAANIRSVLRLFMETNGELNSRPVFLQRQQQ